MEIARRILDEAGAGVRFDEMAVFLRSPHEYLGLLENAFERAGIEAWFDRGPVAADRLVLGGSWSAYWYNGHIYSSEIQRGFDVLKLTGRAFADCARVSYLNVQTQVPFRG